jgi:hypothetical protein
MLRSVLRLFIVPFLSEAEVEAEVARLTRSDPEISVLYAETRVRAHVRECPPGVRACYHTAAREIWVSPTDFERASLREALLHEYIHAHDHLVGNIDVGSVGGLSVSEVHAAMRCECRGALFHRACAFAKAVDALACAIGSHAAAREAVGAVFADAYARFSPAPADDPPLLWLRGPYD